MNSLDGRMQSIHSVSPEKCTSHVERHRIYLVRAGQLNLEALDLMASRKPAPGEYPVMLNGDKFSCLWCRNKASTNVTLHGSFLTIACVPNLFALQLREFALIH